MAHVTVMKREAVEALALLPSSIVVDATLGAGGHTREILKALGRKSNGGTLIALDADASAIEAVRKEFESVQNIRFEHANFRALGEVLAKLCVPKVNAILADLGWRMEQFEGGGKGFSFRRDEPLLMTYGDPEGYSFSAGDIVNAWDEEVIRNILKGYGEERFAGRIARNIVEARSKALIETSAQLAAIIERAVPGFARHGKTHPATKSFQALRIAVNDEFEALEEFIQSSVKALAKGGRLAIITFHSLEDRIVKQAFKKSEDEAIGKRITKKPITASREEIAENPRARSAKLRVIEKL